MLNMLVPAFAVGVVGLIQGAGISRAVPNPDGTYPSVDRDFVGQGAANAGAALFGGMPVGASLSSTELNVQLGGRHRAANFIIGPIIAALFVTVWDIYGVTFKEFLPEPSGGSPLLSR